VDILASPETSAENGVLDQRTGAASNKVDDGL
jgi:hypothetical protein